MYDLSRHRKLIQDGGGLHLEIRFNGYNSGAMTYMSAKFCTRTCNDIPETNLPSKFTYHNIHDGDGRHVDINTRTAECCCDANAKCYDS